MRIVTGCAICSRERLVLMSRLQLRVFGIVTIEAKRGSRLGQVEIELDLATLSYLMSGVAGVAPHVERRVAATLLGDIQARRMAAEAQIFFRIPGGCFHQLILVFRGVRIVALQTIAHRWRMNLASDLGRIFVRMAGKTKLVRRGRDQLYVGDVVVGADLVANGATGGNGGVDSLAPALVFVTLRAGGGIGLGIERNRVLHRERCEAPE